MIKVHIGLKGSGKTKKLITAVNAALNIENGNVVCITEGNRLIHDIDRKVRMVNTEDFDIKNMDMFEGLICGIIAQDFDVTHIFIDSVFKSVPAAKIGDLEGFVLALEKLEKKFDVSFTMMVSAEADSAGVNLKKYID
ncbi:MAG: hypothetical protein RSB38_03370 [Oscillospiraceae bacterium]